MKSTIKLLLATIIAVFTLCGCGGDSQQNQDGESNAESGVNAPNADNASEQTTAPAAAGETPAAHIVRMMGYSDTLKFPLCRMLDSVEALDAFLSEMSEWFAMDAASETLSGFDESFFKSRCLVAVVLQESNGGVTHAVTGITYDGENVLVHISRKLPQQATITVMTPWMIFVELPQKDAALTPAAEITTEVSP